MILDMKEGKLNRYFSNQLRRYRKRHSKIGQSQDAVNIHQLRLSIKKLRSILRLVEISSKGKFSKDAHFDLLANVFKEAGKVREIQMNMELIHQQTTRHAQDYDEYFEKKLEKSIARLRGIVKEFDKTKLKRLNKKFLRLSNSLNSDRLRRFGLRFIRERYVFVDKTMKKNGDPWLLHKVRINLKMMLETLIIVRKIRSNKAMERVRKELVLLNQHLGEWHDYQVLIAALQDVKQHPRKGIIDARSSKLLKRNKKKERDLRKRVVREVGAHLSQAKISKSLQLK